MLAVVAALSIPAAILVAPFAQAGTVPPFTIGDENPDPDITTINIPGSDATGPNASNPNDPEGNTKELGPLNSNTTKIGVIHNDVPPTLGLTNPNGQVDLSQAWINSKNDGPGGTGGDDWVYFAWERDANSGSGFIAYEFMQKAAPAVCDDYDPSDTAIVSGCNPWANRDGDTDGTGPDIGDFMILWDQQGGSKDLFYRKWTGTAPNLTLTAPVLLTPSVAVAEYSVDGFRGEAAINITDVVFGGVPSCLAFANIIPSTVTGNSDTADYKDTILQPGVDLANCTTTTTTTPKTGAGANIPTPFPITAGGLVAVKDSALITLVGGSATAGGTVDFTLCRANNSAGDPNTTPPTDPTSDCDVGGPNVLVGDDIAVSGSFPVTVTSPTAWVTAAGRYCWKAVYTGNPTAGYSGSSDTSVGECFVIDPVDPTLSTDAGDDEVVLGAEITDTATLGGTAYKPTTAVIHTASNPVPSTRTKAGGTIQFKLLGPDNCTTVAYDSDLQVPKENAAVIGDDDYTASTTPTAAGDYHWVAYYSGDSPNTNSVNHNTDCSDTDEDVTVTTVTPTMSTAQTWVPNDSATITATAGGDLTGSVTFNLYSGLTCAGTALYTESVAIPASAGLSETVKTANDGVPAADDGDAGYTANANGDFSWGVSYDSTNPAQDDLAQTCKEVSTLSINNNYTPPSS